MPNLIWFEWEKCLDGYTVETLRPDYLRFSKEDFSCLAQPTDSAPAWVRQMLRELGHRYEKSMEGSDLEDEYLIPRSDKVLKFQPLEGNSSAFMEFADCCDSVSNTLRFVSKYGLPQEGPQGYQLWLPIRCVEEIQGDAEDMWNAIRCWEVSKKRNEFDELIPLFNWLAYAEDGDDYNESGPSPASVNVRFRHRADRAGPPLLSMIPKDLKSALWLQFGQAVSANSQLQRCAVCPSWFSYGTGTGKRKSAHYCSDRCRKAAHRHRKESRQ